MPYTLAHFEVMLPEQRIQEKVRELGTRIADDYRGSERELVIVGVLKGSLPFMADLIRSIELPLHCDFLRVSSYHGGTQSTGVVRFDFDLTQPIKDKDVLLVEDIIDTGLTMDFLLQTLRLRAPASLRVCSLLHKPARTVKPVEIDYLGFTIENRFVIGYGLDLEGKYRNLRDILALRPEVAAGARAEDPTP